MVGVGHGGSGALWEWGVVGGGMVGVRYGGSGAWWEWGMVRVGEVIKSDFSSKLSTVAHMKD